MSLPNQVSTNGETEIAVTDLPVVEKLPYFEP
jgi:hypothetical protein